MERPLLQSLILNMSDKLWKQKSMHAIDNIILQLYRSRSTIVEYESSIVLILSVCPHDSFFHLRYFQLL